MNAQFHLLSFEGPDAYSMAGGIGSRVSGLASGLADLGHDTHLWFVGDPDLPGHEDRGSLHLHRWCQWMSRHHGAGVYDGEGLKAEEYARSLPPELTRRILRAVASGHPCVVMAEEWHTVGAVFHLDHLLRTYGIRDRVSILWNANNTFGFAGIDWPRLAGAALVTTVSRYMKHVMKPLGVDAMVIPNGLSVEAFGTIEDESAQAMRSAIGSRTLLTKVARWDPDKRWLATLEIVASLKREGARPLLVARGGIEAHGIEVLATAHRLGLRVTNAELARPGSAGVLEALESIDGTGADVVNIRSHLDWEARRLLYRESAAVLANSEHEPFGLVGLEAMAVGGMACTGCTGEDYAVPGHNALVLETSKPEEFLALFQPLRDQPAGERALREAGRFTATRYAWPTIIQNVLLPRARLGFVDSDRGRELGRPSAVPLCPRDMTMA